MFRAGSSGTNQNSLTPQHSEFIPATFTMTCGITSVPYRGFSLFSVEPVLEFPRSRIRRAEWIVDKLWTLVQKKAAGRVFYPLLPPPGTHSILHKLSQINHLRRFSPYLQNSPRGTFLADISSRR